ncbi:hypothetical protein QEZ54_29850 [Catellatospora sp. KI3]|uniref:hypothetical protein n=1 Tax=Catellatospora sp. KI3 TaxID=3041620 RepID=UPI002482941B|nr:hypothetical protein [Catellatospora sp. KI3]MDI1465181.1 hypothetical protein [Catellatospora sp. KI3]
MDQVPTGVSLLDDGSDPSAAEVSPHGGQPLCDGCGQPSPCTTVTHTVLREFAADFARSYSGL